MEDEMDTTLQGGAGKKKVELTEDVDNKQKIIFRIYKHNA